MQACTGRFADEWIAAWFGDYAAAGAGRRGGLCGGGDASGVWRVEFDEYDNGDGYADECATRSCRAIHFGFADGDGDVNWDNWAGVCGALV